MPTAGVNPWVDSSMNVSTTPSGGGGGAPHQFEIPIVSAADVSRPTTTIGSPGSTRGAPCGSPTQSMMISFSPSTIATPGLPDSEQARSCSAWAVTTANREPAAPSQPARSSTSSSARQGGAATLEEDGDGPTAPEAGGVGGNVTLADGGTGAGEQAIRATANAPATRSRTVIG